MAAGLLIVNADDWGMDRLSTDAILECFDRGAVTSASAMIYMADSERAARIGRERWLPLGLHLNLIRPFADPSTPAEVRDRQRRLAAYLARARWRRWVPNPFLFAAARRCVEDQRRRFVELYGREPTHVDSEQHVHTWPNVLLGVRAGTKVRLSHTFAAGEKPAWNRAVRAIVNALIRRRFVTTAYLLDLRRLRPERLALARRAAVEVMVHPADDDQRAYLLSDEWRSAIAGLRLGSYADLRD
jgi:chitin disaccharide deacetylase